MTERLPADHDAIETHRVHLERVGRTRRLRVPLPPDLSIAAGDVVRLSLSGDPSHAAIEATLDDRLVVDRAAENPRLARTKTGPDRLAPWLADLGASAGDPLLFDVVTESYAYGLRPPGERVVYDAPDAPDPSLADIADGLE